MRHHSATSNEDQARRLAPRFLAFVLAMVSAAMLLGAGTASAVVIRGQVEAFGPDGTAASSFGSARALAFNQGARELYAVDQSAPGIYGFDVSAPPTHSLLSGFSPLTTVATGGSPGVAVDNTALASAGNVYYVSESTMLIYGYDSSGTPLGGNFPIDPAVTPGAPAGSPKDVCGAAVDSAGNLWVANFNTRSILEYDSAGVYQGAVSTAAQGFFPCFVAFDSNDDMYVTNGGDSSKATYKYTAASGYATATLFDANSGRGNAVDRLTDHAFLIDSNSVAAVDEFGSTGNPVSTTSVKDPTGTMIIPTSSGIAGASFRGVTIDSANSRVYVSDEALGKIRVFGDALTYPDLTVGTASALTNTSATVDGTVSAQGIALSECRFEYVTEAAFGEGGFTDLSSGGSAPCSPAAGSIPADSATHPVSGALSGLERNTSYRVRLLAANANGSIATPSAGFETIGPPLVETTGSPVRTASTARLDARVNPQGAAATYHFEYGAQGSCDSNPCTATEPHAAGSGEEVELVSQQLEGLEPNTTYHYRVIADNGNPDGAAVGEDMSLTTFASDAPLSHGHFPGPPGSDRAWEQVSAPDTGGNPVASAPSISDAGDRAIYSVLGGTPSSEVGTQATRLFAERTPSGWQTRKIFPSRAEATSETWIPPGGPSDLSEMVAPNRSNSRTSGEFSIWRMTPIGPPAKLLGYPDPTTANGYFSVSDDGSRVLAALFGTQDPEHPVAAGSLSLYDISSGSPRLISLLPGGAVTACIPSGSDDKGFPGEESTRSMHWLSADGSFTFFPSTGHSCDGIAAVHRLYERDIEAETTRLISTPSVSGPECDAYFIKSTSDAAFFYARGRLVAEDSQPSDCMGSDDGDIYRYDLGSGDLRCVTCVVPGRNAGVSFINSPAVISRQMGVAADGSRVYFRSVNRLLPGAPAQGGSYRVDVESGDLAYIGELDSGSMSENGFESAISADGSVAIFASKDASLNAIGGQQNGGTLQYYRYDDRDRSLVCVSCPADGSAPRGDIDLSRSSGVADKPGMGANTVPLSSDGEVFAFSTPTPLVSVDQNTAKAGQEPNAGSDVYEWRSGRLLLISDGLTNWPGVIPHVAGVTPSGRDVFFLEAAQLTPDALDGYTRLYDARIGGGLEFPVPPRPCALEVCQGIPEGAPEKTAAGTMGIAGPGNASKPRRPVCTKPKRKVRRGGKVRCVKPARLKHGRHKHDRKPANHDRRTAR